VAINTQAGAYAVKGECVRVVSAPTNASLIMREGSAGDASPVTFIINDSPNTVVVWPAVGEAMNGVTNGNLPIPASQYAFMQRIPRIGVGGGVPDYRTAVIT
jgi:hypothetical protein